MPAATGGLRYNCRLRLAQIQINHPSLGRVERNHGD